LTNRRSSSTFPNVEIAILGYAMETEAGPYETVGGIVGGVIGFVFGTIAPAMLWMWIFVVWFKYDYVTSSSVFFFISLVGAVFFAIAGLFLGRNAVQKISAVIIWLGFFPFLTALGLSFYVNRYHPVISTAFDLTGAYRSAVNYAFAFVFGGLRMLPPVAEMFRAVFNFINESPLLSNIVGALIVAVLMQVGGLRALLVRGGSSARGGADQAAPTPE
jgi:hypothetical protein